MTAGAAQDVAARGAALRSALEPLTQSLAETQTLPSSSVDVNRQLTLFEAGAAAVRRDAKELVALLSVAEGVEAGAAVEPLRQLASACCSWLRGHEDLDSQPCIAAALGLLSLVVGLEPQTDQLAIQKGIFISLLKWLSRPTSDVEVVKRALEVLAVLSVAEGSDQTLSRLDAVPQLISLLLRRENDEVIVENVATTLALFAQRSRHRRALLKSEQLRTFADLLRRHGERASVIVAICRFVSGFAVKEDACLALLHSGCLDALLATFDAVGAVPDAALRDELLATRGVLTAAIRTCAADCTEIQARLVERAWLTTLAAALEAAPRDAELYEASLSVARGLSRRANFRETVVNLGFVDIAMQSMSAFKGHPAVLKEACGLFGNLASDPELRSQLGEMDVPRYVLEALDACRGMEDRKCAKLALGALSNLASDETNRAAMAKLDPAPVLLQSASMFMDNESILEYAIGAISHLAANVDCSQQLAEHGALEALLLFMKDHMDDKEVVVKSVIALRRLVKFGGALEESQQWEPGLFRRIIACGQRTGAPGIALLVDSMTAHVYDEGVVRETVLLLTSMTRLDGVMPLLMKMSYTPCMKALEVHQSELSVRDAVGNYLARLPLEEDEGWAKGELDPAF